jgi:glutathione S-transferase
MSALQLYYTHNLNPRVAVSVARHLDLPVEFARYSPMGDDREAFLPLNPNSLAPLLVEDGQPLWETDAIALRLSRLSGTDFWLDTHPEEMMRWVSWSAHHFTRAGGTIVFEAVTVPLYMGRAPDPAVLDPAMADFRRFATILDDVLAGRDWLVGGGLSYADFRVATALPFAGRAGLPVGDYRHIARWHDRLNAIDAWREPFAGIE